MIKSIHHAGVGVRDMEASIRFYRDLLGLEVTRDDEVEGPLVSAIVGHAENTKVRIVHLGCGEGQEIELFQYTEPATSRFPQDYRQCDGGIIHVAVIVDDVMGMYERLKEQGVRFNSQPYNLGGHLVVYMRDPDGVTVELMQFDVDD